MTYRIKGEIVLNSGHVLTVHTSDTEGISKEDTIKAAAQWVVNWTDAKKYGNRGSMHIGRWNFDVQEIAAVHITVEKKNVMTDKWKEIPDEC